MAHMHIHTHHNSSYCFPMPSTNHSCRACIFTVPSIPADWTASGGLPGCRLSSQPIFIHLQNKAVPLLLYLVWRGQTSTGLPQTFLQDLTLPFQLYPSHQQLLCVYALGSAMIWLQHFLLDGLVGLRNPYLALKPSLALPGLYSIPDTVWTGGFD